MHAAAKAGNVRKLVALVLHERPMPIKVRSREEKS